jgi:hypothetical protein
MLEFYERYNKHLHCVRDYYALFCCKPGKASKSIDRSLIQIFFWFLSFTVNFLKAVERYKKKISFRGKLLKKFGVHRCILQSTADDKFQGLNSTTVFAQSIACSVASSSFFVQAAGGLFLPRK